MNGKSLGKKGWIEDLRNSYLSSPRSFFAFIAFVHIPVVENFRHCEVPKTVEERVAALEMRLDQRQREQDQPSFPN